MNSCHIGMIMGRRFLWVYALIGAWSMIHVAFLNKQTKGKHRLTASTVQEQMEAWTRTQSSVSTDKHPTLSTPKLHNHEDSINPKPIFVLHVGPHKTGTTTIQAALGNDATLLKSDNYTFLGTFHPRSRKGEFVRPGITAFKNTQSIRVLFQGIMRHFQKEPSSMIMSDEFLSFWARENEDKARFFHLFKKKFQGWDIHVVVGYRRYHEWLVSLYNQRHKKRGHEESFVDWYRTSSHSDLYIGYGNDCKQTYFAMKKLFDSVSILNVHSPVKLMTDFYCNTIPSAANACEGSKIHNEAIHANPSVPLWPGAIARTAIQTSLTRLNDAQMLEQPIIEFSNGINYTLPLVCLSPTETRDILQKTIEYEEILVPDFFASESGEKVLLDEFKAAVKDKKFCSVDTNKVLQDERWRSFLREYSI